MLSANLMPEWMGAGACRLPIVPRGTQTLTMLAAGIDGPGQALTALGVPWNASGGLWDLISDYGPLLRKMGHPAQHIFVGKFFGDVLRVQLSTRPGTLGFVAGPPCPPFSSLGQRGVDEDDREKVFRRLTMGSD